MLRILWHFQKIKRKKGDYNSEVLELSDIVIGMYEDAIKSYKENNIELAQRVINRDDDVDRRYEKLLMTLQMLIQKRYHLRWNIYSDCC